MLKQTKLMASLSLAALLLLSGCATKSPDKAQQLQANFDWACYALKGAVKTTEPMLPLITAKLGDNGVLAIRSAYELINTACSEPLDVNNAAAVTARVFDAAGQIAAIVVKAQQAP